jgi:hypothetical protein
MNGKTAKLLRRKAIALDAPKRKLVKMWEAAPHKLKGQLRGGLKRMTHNTMLVQK